MTVETPSGITLELLSLPDLVTAKKTQRDKDWPMIRRLIEANYVQHRGTISVEVGLEVRGIIRLWSKQDFPSTPSNPGPGSIEVMVIGEVMPE